MKLLKFERINQLIVVAVQGSDPDYLKKFKTSSDEFNITFSEYVKSQLHFNVVTDLLNRDIYDYLRTYQFLEGDGFESESAYKVLRYFYEDMKNFLINNTDDMKLDLVLDFNESLKEFCSIKEIKKCNKYEEILNFFMELKVCDDPQRLFEIVNNSEFSFIIDSIEDLDDLQNKINSYILATALHLYLDTEISDNNLVEFLEVHS